MNANPRVRVTTQLHANFGEMDVDNTKGRESEKKDDRPSGTGNGEEGTDGDDAVEY